MLNDLCCIGIDGGGKRKAKEAVLIFDMSKFIMPCAGTDFLAQPIDLNYKPLY